MTVFKGQGVDCFGNQLPTINGDTSRLGAFWAWMMKAFSGGDQ